MKVQIKVTLTLKKDIDPTDYVDQDEEEESDEPDFDTISDSIREQIFDDFSEITDDPKTTTDIDIIQL